LEDFFRADKIKIKKILPLGRQLSRGFVLLSIYRSLLLCDI